jgi:cobalt-zinc-cadmium efflux system membrane fusion protein
MNVQESTIDTVVLPHDEKPFVLMPDGENAPTASEIDAETDAETSDAPTAEEKSDAQRSSKIKRALGWAITTAVVLLTIVFGYRLLFVKENLAADPKIAAPDSAAIKLAPEQRQEITVEVAQKHAVQGAVKSPGKIAFNANQISPVLPQFSGKIVKLNAEIGNTVRAGQVLGVIETPDIVQPQADFQQSLANLRTAQTSLEKAVRTRERSERLAQAEAIARREAEDARIDEAHAREDLARAQQAVAAAKSKLQTLHFSEAEIKTLESGGKVLSREVPLVAPIAGTIVDRKAGLGQIVQPGGDALFQIANLSTIWVNAEVYEDQLSKLRVGLPVTVETAAYPNERFTARVDQIGSTVDADKHTVAVRCVTSNVGGKLKPGMFVTVSLGGVSNAEVITVPATAIVTNGSKRLVFVETEPNRYEKREIVTGDEQNGEVIVKSGLNEGERIVVKGGLLLAAEEK